MKTGWLCPRCDKINAPNVLQCNCSSESSPAQIEVPIPVYVIPKTITYPYKIIYPQEPDPNYPVTSWYNWKERITCQSY